MNSQPPIKGSLIGKWKLIEKIGWGGNGDVWKVTADDREYFAAKILTKTKEIAYERFRNEVFAINKNSSIIGILPIFDYYLPDKIELTVFPWYVMPLASPLAVVLKDSSISDIVKSIAEIAKTLKHVHNNGFAHRDIKPENLLEHNGIVCLADFGICDFDDKPELTGKKEILGPKATMAPEVRLNVPGYDAKCADVYSLLKTMWILITKSKMGFEGQFIASSSVGIESYCERDYIKPLEDLLFDSTDHDPNRRPSLDNVIERLEYWLSLQGNYHEISRLEWLEIIDILFPFVSPITAKWTNAEEITRVLNLFSGKRNINHLFFPNGGGGDVRSAKLSIREPGTIELNIDSIPYIINPKSLTFEEIKQDITMNYFRLEANELSPCGVYSDNDSENDEEDVHISEEVAEIGGKFYAESWHIDENEYNGAPLPPGSRSVVRFFKGNFVIFHKFSTYNMAKGKLDAYDGRHHKMDAQKFRDYVEKLTAAALKGGFNNSNTPAPR